MKLSNALRAIFLSLVFAVPILAQPAGTPDLNRPRTYDVQHYVLRVSFDIPKRTVIGDTTVRLTPLKGPISRVELDSADLRYTSVILEPGDKDLKYQVRGDKVVVELDKTYSPGEIVSIRFKYTARPKKGVYFVAASNGRDGMAHSQQIWTQGQPDEAHHWFPSFDFPSDKATTEQYITAPADLTVIGNGTLVAGKPNQDGTVTHHFMMPVPHSTYLVSFVIGEYKKIEESHREIPLGYYVYPGIERIVPKAYGKTAEMIRIFEDLAGMRFPYNKYDQTMVAGFEFGGMENITATTMADTEIMLAGLPFMQGNVEDLVAHEIIHSWFGYLVTCKNWAELWLNEGMATFFEAAVRERMYGRQDYIRKITNNASSFMSDDIRGGRRFGLFNRNADNTATLFDRPAITYDKGGAVIHMLRGQVGDEAFWKALKIYLDRHKYGNVETQDLRKVMEEASKQDLGWFFDQWVYTVGFPRVNVKPVYDPEKKLLTLNIEQRHRSGSLTPEAFRLPLEFKIVSSSGEKTASIDLNQRQQRLEIPLDSPPTTITADPLSKVPIAEITLADLK